MFVRLIQSFYCNSLSDPGNFDATVMLISWNNIEKSDIILNGEACCNRVRIAVAKKQLLNASLDH